ncbi:MAG: PLP-dependent aminotransferase family protein [Candidatus Bipolaricaulota bacterium]|nr:PLP-dependent aminotransferase family protein [Candidatus Bipolaricaulota bacterium]MCS7273950.1 PLP-dependent aminotransferase family protein [Candidatus Bipolaricaulota bacterium]MDW8111026.1 PLP-dependent aminotransferase family protein [Candidatus Bipolaricaulota bacterium]MDW8329275.1 PLP-dependent aminotransferase family protein [Candidatus Bipolaricaulota bacterium]
MRTLWTTRYAQRTQRMQSSAVRELLKLTEQPDVISFAGGLPAPEVFPVEEFRAACQRVLDEHGPKALQYSTTEGYRPLREMIARHTARYGIVVDADHILITSGSQQALDLIGQILLNPGDHVVVERPTYVGALQAWNAYQVEYVTVGLDDEGMKTEELEEALRSGPKFIYVLPNFHNPAGVTLALERRRHLIELAAHYGVPIVEDDPYGQLRYEGEHLPPLVVLDHQYHAHDGAPYSGNVIYLSTFSKILAPGLRLGWVIAPKEIIHKLVQAKQGADLHTSTFNQMVAYEVARGGFLDRHVRVIREVYRARRDAMLSAMARYFPDEVRWTRPQGGLFLWVVLPESVSAVQVLQEAIKERVAFVPGASFYPDGSGQNTLRLNFSNATPEKIEEGIRRLGKVLKSFLPSTDRSRVEI